MYEPDPYPKRGIYFVDNVTWVVKGDNDNEVVWRLSRCAAMGGRKYRPVRGL